MKKKIIIAASLALVVVVLVVILVACQAQGQQDQQQPQDLRQEVQQTEQPTTAELTPETTVETTAEVTPELTPAPTPETTVELTPEITPEPTDQGLTFKTFYAPMFAAEDLNVYSEPDTASAVLGIINKDGFVGVNAISEDGIWVKVENAITSDGKLVTGYIILDQLITLDEFDQQQQSKSEYTFTDCNETVYATGTVNQRTGPSEEFEKVGSLSKGDSATRIGIGVGNASGWSKIKLSDGTIVYVSDSYLSTTKPSTQSQQPQSGGNQQKPQGGSGSGSGSQQKPGGSSGGSGGGTGSSEMTDEEFEKAMEELLRQRDIAKGIDPDSGYAKDPYELGYTDDELPYSVGGAP